MPLQDATAAKIASDAAAIQTSPVLNEQAVNRMNSEITTQSTRTDTDERIYSARLRYNADLHNGNSPAEIIQNDQSRILISDFRSLFVDKGYRVSVVRQPKPNGDHVMITVAW